MKVFMLIRYLNYSGASKMFLWVAEHLAESGHDVTVLAFSDNVDRHPSDKIHFINENLMKKGFVGRVSRIRQLIKESGADVSISFLLDANVYNTFACIGTKAKSIICERNDPFKPGYYKLKFWKPCFRLADGAVFQLKKVREYYDNIKGTTAVIPNPILCRTDIACESFEKRKKAIVTHGRLDLFQKRHDVLIEAFSKFHADYPEYELHIYGSGQDENVIMEKIKNKGLTDSVKLMGVTQTPQETIKDYQIYAFTSDFEGIPNSLIDAMSVGLPCVATDCRPGGASLLLEDGMNGFLVEARDVDAIYKKMVYFLQHPETADTFGEKAKGIKEKFAPNKIIAQWNAYLNKLVE